MYWFMPTYRQSVLRNTNKINKTKHMLVNIIRPTSCGPKTGRTPIAAPLRMNRTKPVALYINQPNIAILQDF